MKRQLNREIIDFLNHQSDFVTSEQIARALDISKATVTKRITEMNSKMGVDTQVILSERGKGFLLNSEVYFKLDNRMDESICEERCNDIIKELLFVAPKKLRTYNLYEKFYVSDSVIAKDRLLILEKLKKWNLSLVRSNRYMSIKGSEKDIRSAIMGIVLNLDQTTDISTLEGYCKSINNGTDFLFTIQQVDYASNALGAPISYPYNISLFAHIYVLLERIRLYRRLGAQSKSPNLLGDEKCFSTEIYSICKRIINNIGEYSGVVPDESEVFYLFEYLSTVRISNNHIESMDVPKSSQIALSYIEKVSEKLNQSFSNELYHELKKHIKYLIQRLSNQVYLPNALLKDIEVEYEEIYFAVCQSSIEIAKEYNLPDISKDEAGFISLYFAKYIEIERKKFNAYIICTTGIGTSELIAVKIRQSLPMIRIVGITSNIAIQKIIEHMDEQIDLLITTVPVSEQLGLPTVLVSSILTNRDIEAVSQTLGEIGYV